MTILFGRLLSGDNFFNSVYKEKKQKFGLMQKFATRGLIKSFRLTDADNSLRVYDANLKMAISLSKMVCRAINKLR